MFAPQAKACGNSPKGALFSGLRTLSPMLAVSRLQPSPQLDSAGENKHSAGANNPSIVGLWEVTMYAGTVLWEHAFQQLLADGNETQNSSLYPPEEGNLCYGIWQQQDARTFKLKHYGWIFDKGNLVGKLILTATLHVGVPGAGNNTYSGKFIADVMLPSGELDPKQHAEGTVEAVRLTIN
jgi:hypothetical protein